MSATSPSQVKNALKRCLWGLIDPHPKDSDGVWHYFNNQCAYCGKELAPLSREGHLDHLLSAHKHVSNGLGNFVLACAKCNGDEKRELEWTEFLRHKNTNDEQFNARKVHIEHWIEQNANSTLDLTPEDKQIVERNLEQLFSQIDQAVSQIRNLRARCGENIMNNAESAKLAQYCKSVLSFEGVKLGEEYDYSCIPLCAVDSVFSIGVRYEGVKNVIRNICSHLSIEPSRELCNDKGMSTSEFLDQLSKYSTEKLAEDIFKNRQRTSSTGGILKAEAVRLFLEVLRAHGVEYFEDLPKIQQNISFHDDIKMIAGQKSGISTKYFFMLAGDVDLVKPDRMVIQFLEAGLSRTVAAEECQTLLSSSLKELTPEYPLLNLKTLDNIIWKHQRNVGQKDEVV